MPTGRGTPPGTAVHTGITTPGTIPGIIIPGTGTPGITIPGIGIRGIGTQPGTGTPGIGIPGSTARAIGATATDGPGAVTLIITEDIGTHTIITEAAASVPKEHPGHAL